MDKIQAYIESNIPKRYVDFKPLDSTNKIWLDYYLKIKEMILKKDNLFIFYGKHGTGKTQLACSICILAAWKNNIEAHYTTMLEIILNCLDKQANGNLKKQIDVYCRKKILVIDAFELRKDSEFENRILNFIIDKRYADMKTTIIITNEEKKNILKTLGSAIVDRAKETGSSFDFDWQSFRENKKEINLKKDIETKKEIFEENINSKLIKNMTNEIVNTLEIKE